MKLIRYVVIVDIVTTNIVFKINSTNHILLFLQPFGIGFTINYNNLLLVHSISQNTDVKTNKITVYYVTGHHDAQVVIRYIMIMIMILNFYSLSFA